MHTYVGLLVVLLGLPVEGLAADAASQPAADMVWLMIASALVFLMQAGFALIEGGSSRTKNAVNVVMKNYTDVCFGSLVFYTVGFGLMFGANSSGWLGTDLFFPDSLSAMGYGFVLFQAMFAATAVTIVSGAMAERTRYSAYLIAAMVITGGIYPIFGSWVWGGYQTGSGWLADLGFSDFAGSTVVHAVGGWCALAGILVVGPRLGRFDGQGRPRVIPGHNRILVAVGGFILWFGWFGFNGGSTAAADVAIGRINLNTQLAAAAGLVGAYLTMRAIRAPLLLGSVVNGSLGGLVAITAGCATMTPGFAIVTGLVGGLISVVGSDLLLRCQVDDVVGAVPVHAFCGVWGTVAAGLFYAGDLFNSARIAVQLLGSFVAFAWAFPLALATFVALAATLGLRASTRDEQQGLDYAEHAEVGYPEFQDELLHPGVK